MTDEEVLALLRDRFAMTRPERFTNHPGCEECAEHEETLQARDLDSLSYEEVGSQAWNPITMCQPDAFAYWLPALARIALAPEDEYYGWYGEPLVGSELRWDGPRNWRWQHCTPAQREAVATFVEHLIDTRSSIIEAYGMAYEFLDVLAIWSDGGD